ncbi:10061_t:CDS:2 [Rhizophagus irregularis]|nr:10061_t:CDS:2 [Rhizophagus irregularis]
MLFEIKEPGPGFDYFLNTSCNDWDVVQYHAFWKKSNFGLNKASIMRRFNTQLQKIKEQSTEEEKNNAIRLKKQFQVSVLSNLCNSLFASSSYPWNFAFTWLWTSSPLLQISRTGNIIQGYKRSYRNGKQPIDEMIAIRRGKKQKPAETTIKDGKKDETHGSPKERGDDGSLFSSNCYNDSDVGHGNDNNPFIAQTGGVQRNISHAIDNVVINNVFKNDWIIPDGYNISTDFRKLQVESIEKLKTDLILSYAKEIDMIL